MYSFNQQILTTVLLCAKHCDVTDAGATIMSKITGSLHSETRFPAAPF